MRIEENKKQSPRLICGYERQGRDQEIPRLSCGYRKLREKAIRVKRQTTFELWNDSDTV